jgi:hypothetical protein
MLNAVYMVLRIGKPSCSLGIVITSWRSYGVTLSFYVGIKCPKTLGATVRVGYVSSV